MTAAVRNSNGQPPVARVAMLSVHTCPLATLGGKETGGMNVYVRDLSRELGRRGIAVDVFTRSQDPCVPHVNATLGQNARVIHVPAGPEAPIPKGEIQRYIPEFADGVRAFAESEGITYDVLHSHYWLSGLVAYELQSAGWHAPIVQMFHTLGEMKNRIAQQPSERETAARISGECDIIGFADRLIAATAAEKAQLMWLYHAPADKIRIVPPGVDLQRFHPLDQTAARTRVEVPPDHHLLLFVGRIEPLKGLETLLRAMALVADEHGHGQWQPHTCPGMCLAVIGGSPDADQDVEMSRLKSLRQELGLDEMVTFLGARDQDTLQYYYSAADVVIMPSHYESFGMVALEAMACGTPVIASEVGGLAFLVKHGRTGFHVPDREPRQLADRILALIDDPQLRERLGRQAREYAQAYAWPKIADRILDVYAEVVNARESADVDVRSR